MMKANKFAVIIIAAVLIIPAALFAENSNLNFKYNARINSFFEKGQLYMVPLAPDIIDKCSENCRDLFLYDDKGAEIPSVILTNEPDRIPDVSTELRIVEFKPGRVWDELVLVNTDPDMSQPFLSAQISTGGINFYKQVEISISKDGKHWQKTAFTGFIFDFSAKVPLRKTDIDFAGVPKSSFYKFSIRNVNSDVMKKHGIKLKYDGLDLDVTGGTNEAFRIDRVYAIRKGVQHRGVIMSEKTLNDLNVSQDKDQNTVINIKGGFPIQAVTFDVDSLQPYYYRNVRVYTSHIDTGGDSAYVQTDSGALYSDPKSDSPPHNEIQVRFAASPFYRFVIENRGNPPLNIRSVKFKWPQKEIFFYAPQKMDRVFLHVGNPARSKPEYDMARFVNQAQYGALNGKYSIVSDVVSLSPNSNYRADTTEAEKKDKERARRNLEKDYLAAATAVLIGVLGIWFYKLVAKSKEEEGNNKAGE